MSTSEDYGKVKRKSQMAFALSEGEIDFMFPILGLYSMMG